MGTRPRVFVSPEGIDGTLLRLSEGNCRHIDRVLRLGEGDILEATDGRGAEYLLRLEREDGALQGRILRRREPRGESPLETVLVQAVPKKDLLELVMQKAVELGVSEFRPVLTARTVVALKEEKIPGRMKRWRKILEMSVAQSGRCRLPLLAAPQSWKGFLSSGGEADLKLLLYEKAEKGLGELLGEGGKIPSRVIVAVGPEGSWEPSEVEAALESGFEAVAMGPRILRTETAGIAVLGVLQYLYGDLGNTGAAPADAE